MAEKPSRLLEAGGLPDAEERYGSRSLQRRYTCDHQGVRKIRTGDFGVWDAVQKFIKVCWIVRKRMHALFPTVHRYLWTRMHTAHGY